ncbi:MAG: polysaccharide pyruvyl transferase family protein [Gammaproteobacteria bacterium]|nr:polysaccharide pyruvyl transferase family protein [Gammaproteobacteria bacterium]
MKWAYANFTDSSCNFGNYVIDYATRRLLTNVLPPPVREFDSFREGLGEQRYDAVIVPGCTMLTRGQNPGLECLSEKNGPVFCLAGSIWTQAPRHGFLLRNRILGRRVSAPDLCIANMITGPVGVRDPFTLNTLTEHGIPALYTGCPTLFLERNSRLEGDYVLFSFGRHAMRAQVRAGRRLARTEHVIGIVHEPYDEARIRAAGWDLPLINFRGDIELFLSYFQSAALVVTGRLHGALPSIAYGRRLVYFGQRDTRTTLLDDLGVPIVDVRDIDDLRTHARVYSADVLVTHFKRNWEELLRRVESVGVGDEHVDLLSGRP